MRQIAVSVLVVAMLLPVARPAVSQVTGTTATPGTVVGQTTVTVEAGQATIHGTVLTPGGEPLANIEVRARDLVTAGVEGSTRTTAIGEYSINVNPGSYVLEIVDDAGKIIGTSAYISAGAGTSVTAILTAATGALSAAGTPAGLVATAARALGFAAAAAGVAGVVAPRRTPTASPSR